MVRVEQVGLDCVVQACVFRDIELEALEGCLRGILRPGEGKTKRRRGRVVILRSYGGDRLAPSGEVPRLWGKLWLSVSWVALGTRVCGRLIGFVDLESIIGKRSRQSNVGMDEFAVGFSRFECTNTSDEKGIRTTTQLFKHFLLGASKHFDINFTKTQPRDSLLLPASPSSPSPPPPWPGSPFSPTLQQ